MTDTTAPATPICPNCKGEVAADALKCRHCAEWLPGGSPGYSAALAPAPVRPKARWPKILAIVVGAIVAGFLLLVVLSVLAITFLGTKANTEFKPVGSQLGAPAPRATPAPAFTRG